ncbi:aldo/keto reductase [Microbacterium sp. JZ31]|uniref:aldo/keto reductase n=1 Tax=Microbacterium sp. JZ31 TaxID=1906274 RepID=UPI001932736C|nr:aldo/keto reductase [Microbacterium sp. JZ31]
MKTRALRTGLELTEIGLGAAQFGNLFRETTAETSADAVERAWDAGIRYFDSAPHYGLGLSEERLGAALAGYPRDEYVLSSKVGRLLRPSPGTADRLDDEGFVVPAATRRVWDFSRDGVLRSLDASLARLRTDHLDIVYLHDPDEHWAAASTTGVDALVELREQGVVGAIGVGMNQAEMLAEFIRRCDVDVVMVAGRFTLADQRALDEMLPLALERGVGVVAAAAYNSGLLSAPAVPDDAHYDYGPAPRETIEHARRIARVCEAHGVTLPEAAVQYPLRHPAVASVVLGSRTAEHVASTIERYRAHVPDALWAELDAEGLVPRPEREDPRHVGRTS